MRILLLSPHVPAPMAGASTRDYHMVRMLAEQHDVFLLTLNESIVEGIVPDRSDLAHLVKSMRVIEGAHNQSKRRAQLMAALRGRSYLLSRSILPAMQQAIDEVCVQKQCDVVVCESVMLAGYRLPPGVRVIIDQHNLEYELCWRTYRQEKIGLRKFYSWLEAKRLRPEELRRCRNAKLVLVTSERELVELKRQEPACKVALVPNGVDTVFFQPANSVKEEEPRLVFTGSMDYYPNTDAALFFAHHCWPIIKAQIPEVAWTIVGKNPPPQIQLLAELPGVTVTGSVPDVRPYIEKASLAIAPLRIGSGTRLKILEAFAMQKAVVSTSLGCEGLQVKDGRELVIADEAKHFAAAVIRLLQHAEARGVLGVAGRRLVEAEYSWDVVGRRLREAIAIL